MAKRMLADVLWEATCLFGPGDFSCHAIERAFKRIRVIDEFCPDTTRMPWSFIKSLGVDPNTAYHSHEWFAGKEEWKDSARFMFLLLAAKVAEDEGITV